MLRVVCFKWKPAPGYRSQFNPNTVNILRNMIERHYHGEFELVCITDDPIGIDHRVRIIPLWDDYSSLKNPNGMRNPSCYRRLKVFSAEAEQIIGPRFVLIDLDVVITKDVTPLWNRAEDFVIWGNTHPRTHYNGSMMLMTAGCRQKVWTSFDPVKSPRLTRDAGYFGSDQAWISYCLGKNEAMWSRVDGVYSYRLHIKNRFGTLPNDARIVLFHGRVDPWSIDGQRMSWVREHYR